MEIKGTTLIHRTKKMKTTYMYAEWNIYFTKQNPSNLQKKIDCIYWIAYTVDEELDYIQICMHVYIYTYNDLYARILLEMPLIYT